VRGAAVVAQGGRGRVVGALLAGQPRALGRRCRGGAFAGARPVVARLVDEDDDDQCEQAGRGQRSDRLQDPPGAR
jgi:hypothetical protein